MGVTVIVGAQYGGEGKGKICSHLSITDNVEYVVRCGGPNSGHTVDLGGNRIQPRSIPAGLVNSKTRLLIAPGGLLDVSVLLREMAEFGVRPDRIGVDRNTGIIDEHDRITERRVLLRERCGSTLSGTGSAVARRALRDKSFRLARDVPELRPFVTDVANEVNRAIDRGAKVIVEGTQGYGLSLYHTPEFPYCTSRDTTAASFLGEVGLGPSVVDDVVMAVRTFPIRVAGNSGPVGEEISWERLRELSRYPYPIVELTTVTKRARRVAAFDLELVRRAASANRPTALAVHGVDYIDFRNKGKTDLRGLTDNACRFVQTLEQELGVPVLFVGTGPTNEEIIDRRPGPAGTGEMQFASSLAI
jgi:adenylosuccinate synthase